MTLAEFRGLLRRCALVASVQSSEGSPVEDPATLAQLAQASVGEGVEILRCQGVQNINAIRTATRRPTIGLLKRQYDGTPVYITGSMREVDEVLSTGSEIVALDGTPRPRPNGENLRDLIARIHTTGSLAMADCDTFESAEYALSCGADFVGTTLAGYTDESVTTIGPDLELLRNLMRFECPIIAEGRYAENWQVQAALRIGAEGVVVGGALNDPVKQTAAFLKAVSCQEGPVGAVDIGGTWLRFGVFSADWDLLQSERIPLPFTRSERKDWISMQVKNSSVQSVGISSAGTLDPRTGVVTASKGGVPENVGSEFSKATLGVPTTAINDGLATAWGHACLPQFAGRRVATLALGTGVGCGFVNKQRLWFGPEGQHTRLNDTPAWDGKTIEQVLGGAQLGSQLDEKGMEIARKAAGLCVRALNAFYFPEVIVLCGGVGLSEWLDPEMRKYINLPEEETPERERGWVKPEILKSPFGQEAGLYGAAALSLYPPLNLRGGER